MIFSNDTRINPEFQEKYGIPVIHGQNYYIDEAGFVSTYNLEKQVVFDSLGNDVEVKSITPITEFIFKINDKIAYKTSEGFLVTDLPALKEKYVGGFQGIVGFNETETTYEFLNNKTPKSTVSLTGRINSNKQLELQIGDRWIVPLGEFRCYIGETFYNINYTTPMPNTFGETFTVTLSGYTTVTLKTDTDYIRDAFIAGNTLYLSTRLNIIGSTPYDWTSVDTTVSTVLWSEDSRIVGSYFVGQPTATMFYLVNYNTSSIYWINSSDLSVAQEYQHTLPMLGVGSIDKFTCAVVDKEALTVIGAYVSLNTWLMKVRSYFKFNQLSAYEDMISQYLREDVSYSKDLNTLIIRSPQRASMMMHILGNKVVSGCHTALGIIGAQYGSYLVDNKILYRYRKVEDSGEYEPIDISTGTLSFDNFIYIGSDLEPDNGGSTMQDTEIVFEGKINIIDGNSISTESSSDVPIANDIPIRTDQSNPDNWWYLYTKTLRYPISYSDWTKISLMPTTKIYNIRLVSRADQQKKSK